MNPCKFSNYSVSLCLHHATRETGVCLGAGRFVKAREHLLPHLITMLLARARQKRFGLSKRGVSFLPLRPPSYTAGYDTLWKTNRNMVHQQLITDSSITGDKNESVKMKGFCTNQEMKKCYQEIFLHQHKTWLIVIAGIWETQSQTQRWI